MNDHFMTRKQVVAVTGRSATSLWRDVNAGAFPPPRQISAARIGWLHSEILEWLQSRPVVTTKAEAQAYRHKIPAPDSR